MNLGELQLFRIDFIPFFILDRTLDPRDELLNWNHVNMDRGKHGLNFRCRSGLKLNPDLCKPSLRVYSAKSRKCLAM